MKRANCKVFFSVGGNIKFYLENFKKPVALPRKTRVFTRYFLKY